MRTHLPKYLLTKSKGSFQQSVYDKIIDNEDVQFYWVLLSQDIENSDAWMEVYKKRENRNTQKSTGLRKSLSGVS